MISIIIPVYNESESLEELFNGIQQTFDTQGWKFEAIFVNDGSSDDSLEVLHRIQKNSQHVKVINFLRNFGQTAALSAGIDRSKYDIIVPMDADLQNDPKDIPGLVQKLQEGFDIVSGWRKHRKDSPLKRNLLSRIANFLIRKFTKVELHDLGCTLKAYRKEVLLGLNLYGEMHRFIPIYAKWNGALRITEMQVSHHPRKHGVSKYGVNRVVKVILDLMVVLFLNKYGQKPMYVFGIFGIFNLSLSFVCALGSIYYKFISENYKSFIQTPLPLMSSVFFVVGVVCILLGLLAELSIRTYYESQSKKTYKVKD